jgi:hypothetical protein
MSVVKKKKGDKFEKGLSRWYKSVTLTEKSKTKIVKMCVDTNGSGKVV